MTGQKISILVCDACGAKFGTGHLEERLTPLRVWSKKAGWEHHVVSLPERSKKRRGAGPYPSVDFCYGCVSGGRKDSAIVEIIERLNSRPVP